MGCIWRHLCDRTCKGGELYSYGGLMRLMLRLFAGFLPYFCEFDFVFYGCGLYKVGLNMCIVKFQDVGHEVLN